MYALFFTVYSTEIRLLDNTTLTLCYNSIHIKYLLGLASSNTASPNIVNC